MFFVMTLKLSLPSGATKRMKAEKDNATIAKLMKIL